MKVNKRKFAYLVACVTGLALGCVSRLVFCPPEVKVTTKTSVVYKDIEVNELRKNVSYHGSVKDYNLLKRYYWEHGQYERIFYYSLLMAEKYKYHPAYRDVYKALDWLYSHYSIGTMDKECNKIAEYYYKKSQAFP